MGESAVPTSLFGLRGRLGCVLPLGQDGLGWESQSDSDRIARMARTKPSKPARAEPTSGEEAPNPVWFKPVMFGFMLVGLAWIIVFYVSQGRLPIADLGSWNILIGFGIAFVGFLMTTRWR
jgi:cell division protein CrgA